MREIYRDQVSACWLGKCLGGAIGMAYEGVPWRPDLREEDIFLQDVPNDDLELQLVWLRALEEYGTALDHAALGKIWLKYIPHGVDEYAVALRNLKRGIFPPASGWKDNFFADGMGAAIRSEIWAAVFAGRPDAAGYFASLDASVDHWGDGVYAEVYMAMAECFAFEMPNPDAALKKALAYLPECRLSRALREVHRLFDAGTESGEAREILWRTFRHPNFTDCVMNLATVTFALLWGDGDFIRTILLAVNMGRDTDCTAATAGAFLGITGGSGAIPEKWRNKVREELTVSDFIRQIPGIPLTLSDLTERTLSLHKSLPLPEKLYPFYTPYVSEGREVSLDRSVWLVLRESECDIRRLEQTLAENGECPAELREHLVVFDGLTMDLAPYAEPGGNLHLFSFLAVENPALDPDDVYLSATADTGLTVWMDGKKLFDQFSRARMLPSFHRAEGGMCFRYPLKHGDRKLVHIRLYSCIEPLRCTFMFGSGDRDHLEGFHLSLSHQKCIPRPHHARNTECDVSAAAQTLVPV